MGEDFMERGRRPALSRYRVARNLPCPTCKMPNRLTAADVARGYQCDECANLEEGPL